MPSFSEEKTMKFIISR